MERYISSSLQEDIQKKMVFVGGPRQVGKTTLAFNIAKKFPKFHKFEYPEKLIVNLYRNIY